MFQYLNKFITPNLVFKITKLVTLCFACTMILFACKQDKDILPTPTMTEKRTGIDITKAFFNAYMDFIPRNFKFKSIKPFYEGAVLDGNVVEIPFAVDSKMASISQYDNFEKLGKQRLIVVNTPNVGLGKACYIVNYAPSKTFAGKIADVTVRNFQAKQYDGAIIVQDLDGKNVVGYSIEGGKITNTLSPRQDAPNKRGKLDFCEVSTYIQYCQGSMGDYTTALYPCGWAQVVDCYFFGTYGGGSTPWSDGGGGDNWTGGGGGGGTSGNGVNNGGPNDPSWGWGNNNAAGVPITVVQMCPYSIMQGFLEAGSNYTPYIAGANMGSLAGRNVVSAGGHYLDLVAPAIPGGIYIPRFGIDISELNTDAGNPNAVVGNIESISTDIANAYQLALDNYMTGRRLYVIPSGTFSPGLDFLNEWKAAFNQAHPNRYMDISFNGNPGVQVRDANAGCIR
jgi:hypothetical protein